MIIVTTSFVAFLVTGRRGARPALTPQHTQLTYSGNVSWTEISPDGELLAYVEEGSTNRLLVQDLAGGTVIEIAKIGELVTSLRWSPDGTSLLFRGSDSAQRLVTVTHPRLGGPTQALPALGAYVVWSPNGSEVAHWWQGIPDSQNPIKATTLATGRTRVVEGPESDGLMLRGDWSPTGRFIALGAKVESPESWELWTLAVDGSRSHRLVEDTVPVFGPRRSPSGEAVYYMRGDELRKVRIAADGRARGASELLHVGLEVGFDFNLGRPPFSLAANGRKLVFTKVQSHSNLWLASATGSADTTQFATRQLTTGSTTKSDARLSPDGQWIAYTQWAGNVGDVFVIPADGGTPRQVTSGGEVVTAPVWSPNGTALAFGALRDRVVKVMIVSVESGRTRAYEGTEMGYAGLAWAPNRRILYSRPDHRNFHLLDLQTEVEEPLVSHDSVGHMFDPHFSPDGQRVAVQWNQTEGFGVWVVSLKDSSHVRIHSQAFSWPAGWTADGRFVYVRSDSVYLVPGTGVGEATVFAPMPFEKIRRVSERGGTSCVPVERPDGPTLLCTVMESVSDAWMIENFDPEIR